MARKRLVDSGPEPSVFTPHQFERSPGGQACIHCGLGLDNDCHGVKGPFLEYLKPVTPHAFQPKESGGYSGWGTRTCIVCGFGEKAEVHESNPVPPSPQSGKL